MNIKFLGMYLLACICLVGFRSEASGPSMFSVFSWNILGPSVQDVELFFPQVPGQDRYDRLDRILIEIKKSRAEIVCLQEIDARSLWFFDSALSLMGYANIAYQSKGGNGGVVLYAKTSAFDRIDSMGVAMDKGAAAFGLLRSKKTGTFIMPTSVHLSRGNDARQANTVAGEKQLQLLQAKMDQLCMRHKLNQPIHRLFAGDFNTLSDEIQRRTLNVMGRQDGYAYRDMFPGVITVNNPDGTVRGSIDHIISSGGLSFVPQHSRVAPLQRLNSLIHQEYPSDHLYQYGVFIDPVVALFSAPAVHASIAPSVHRHAPVSKVVRSLDLVKATIVPTSAVHGHASRKRVLRLLDLACNLN